MSPGNNPYNGGNKSPYGGMNNQKPINTAGGAKSYVSGASNNPYAAADLNSSNNPYAKSPQSQYLKQKVENATRGELTLMLFEGCCKFLKRAKTAFELRQTSPEPMVRVAQIEEINANLIKAENIIMELMASLNFDYDISHKLYPVYNYLYRELVRINFAKDAKALDPVIEIMEGYYETWKEVVKKDRQNKYAKGRDGSFA
jgi:flagellar protein FliS